MTRADDRQQLAREARAHQAFADLERCGLGAIISRRAVVEPLAEASSVRGRALVHYLFELREMARVARDLPRHHVYRRTLGAELAEARNALRRADAARRALLEGSVRS